MTLTNNLISRAPHRLALADDRPIHHVYLPLRPPAEHRIVGHQHQRDFLLDQLFEQIHHLLAGSLIEIAGRLVGQQHRRMHAGGAGNRDALALPAGKLVGAMIGAICQAVILQQLRDACLAFGGSNARQHQRQLDVHRGRQARHQMERLEHEADLLAAHSGLLHVAQRGDVATIQPVGARTRPVQQAYQIKQCRFAGAGRPHDRDIIARRDVQVDAAQRGDLLVADRETAADLAKFDHSIQKNK